MEPTTTFCHLNEAVFIRQKDIRKKVLYAHILWIGVEGSYCDFHLLGGETLTVVHSLSEIGKKLPPELFIRIHRSYIINIHHVDGIIGNTVKIGKNILPVSAPYYKELIPCFNWLEESHTLFKYKKRERKK